MPAPLDEIRVIDAASFIAAPTAAALMADLGADVIKIERPEGESSRSAFRTSDADPSMTAGALTTNRGKRGVALDLGQPAGREVLLRLCESADVLIHNFTVERAERYGLGFDSVRARNPRIVHATLSAYGTRGPDSNRLGFDSTAFWARSGIQSLLGDASAPPVESLAGLGDRVTALNLLVAVLAGLRLRDQTGEPQEVDVALQQTGMWTISSLVQSALMGGPPASRPNRAEPPNPVGITYQTKDGRWLVLRMVMNLDRDWPLFCTAIDRPEWAEEFSGFTSVTENATELSRRIEKLIATQDLEYWSHRLDPTGLMWAPVATLDEVVDDPQLREICAFTRLDHPDLSTVEVVAPPFTIVGADIRARGLPPRVGEHTAQVLSQAGFTEHEMAEFAEQRAFG